MKAFQKTPMASTLFVVFMFFAVVALFDGNTSWAIGLGIASAISLFNVFYPHDPSLYTGEYEYKPASNHNETSYHGISSNGQFKDGLWDSNGDF